MNFPRTLLAIISGILFGCSPYWTGERYVTAAGQRLCAKHHVPLVSTTAYFVDPKFGIVDPSFDVLKAARDLPNALLLPTRRQPPFTVRGKMEYCPECQRIFERRLERYRQRLVRRDGAAQALR